MPTGESGDSAEREDSNLLCLYLNSYFVWGGMALWEEDKKISGERPWRRKLMGGNS